jgi:ATP-binding cassette subfamily F protein 3
MDITSKETLENLLLSYTGTVIFVSHDRYFTNKIATKLLVFESNDPTIFNGTYNEFIHPNTKIVEKVTKEIEKKPKPEKVEYPIHFDDPKPEDPLLAMSYYEASKEKARTENLLKKLEQKSAEAEEKLKKLNEDFVDPEIASDFTKLMAIQAEMENTQNTIDKLANDWMEQSEKLTILSAVVEEKQNTKKD